ncbi:MAG: hypothetical protein IT331_05220 [Anaerolineae bacterium]|nr:hypothetical protein [Anaerolineae bacterium]
MRHVAESGTTSDTRLQRPWLALARIAWVVITVFYLGAYLFTVPVKLSAVPQVVTSGSGITAQEFLARVAEMGVSPDAYVGFFQWLEVLLPLIYTGLGIFIFWRKSDDWMAWLTSLFLITFLGPYDSLAQVNPIWTQAGDLTAVFITLLILLWFFTFPDGHFVPRWVRWVYLLFTGMQVWRLFQPDLYDKNFPVVGLAIFGSILLSQMYRYRHASTVSRQQVKWVLFGLVLGLAPLLLFFVLAIVFLNGQDAGYSTLFVNFFGNFLWYFFLLVLPVSITIAILRSRLFDIDVIIRRTLTYTLVTALLLVVFFGSVILLQRLFAGLTGSGQNEIVTVLSTLAIAALFVPLRNRIQNAIDRRFNRKKYDAQKVLADFANTVRDETDLEKLTARLMQVVDETMEPKSMSLWLKGNQRIVQEHAGKTSESGK